MTNVKTSALLTPALFSVIAAVGCASPHGHGHSHGADHGHSHGVGHGHSHGTGHSHGHGAEVAVPEDALSAQRREIAVRMEAHDFAGARQRIHALLAQVPGDLWAHQLLSDALVELGRIDEAEQALQHVLDLKPTAATYMRASYFLHLRGEGQAALEVSTLAVESSAGTVERGWALAERGELLWQQGELAAAGRAFQAALRLRPELGRAQLGLGRVLAARGEWTRAAALLQTSASTPRELAELASIHMALGQRAAARRALRRAKHMLEDDREHWARSAAVALADHGQRPALAVRLAREELSRRGGVRGYDALAWALTRAGRHREALAAAEQALSLGTREPLMLFHAGMAAAAAGDQAKAATWLGLALEINPQFHVTFPALARETLQNLSKEAL